MEMREQNIFSNLSTKYPFFIPLGTFSVPVILVLGEGVVVMVVDPLLFQGQSLDLQLCALGLLHGLELVSC